MKKCVECNDTLPAPSQIDICASCFQEMLTYKIDNLGMEGGLKNENGNSRGKTNCTSKKY